MKLSIISIFTGIVMLSACQAGSVTETRKSLAMASDVPSLERCEALANSTLGSAIIEKAVPVEKGEQMVGFLKILFVKIFVFKGLPDLSAPVNFCRVTAKLQPVSGSEITAELWLPEDWNGKQFGLGGGGFNGGLSNAALLLLNPVGKGYLSLATNAGHEDTSSAKFAYDSRQQYEDYAYKANHVAAEFAKSLAESYYGTQVKRAYFHGCSNGGRDALMEAGRFPDDYDGIIAGAPAAAWSRLMTSFAWNSRAAQSAPSLKKKLTLVQDAVIAKCDSLDGVTDQILENPASCSFDPAELQCEGKVGSSCLSEAEVDALRKIYAGPHLSDGTKIYAGMPMGGEGLSGNWDNWIFDGKPSQAKYAREFFRWMVYGSPDWELEKFDIDKDYLKAVEIAGPIMNADSPDLTGFVGQGGKLILYHGWNDAAIPATATIDYVQAVQNFLGAEADNHVRLFMVPGMMHCGGGVGPTTFDMLDELDRWVEQGVAPNRVIAAEYDPPAILGPMPGAKPIRTRPLCRWPKEAHYNGAGSTDDANNFSCK